MFFVNPKFVDLSNNWVFTDSGSASCLDGHKTGSISDPNRVMEEQVEPIEENPNSASHRESEDQRLELHVSSSSAVPIVRREKKKKEETSLSEPFESHHFAE
jgi:hypothetical protein